MSTSRRSAMSAAAVPVTFVLVNILSFALVRVAAHVLNAAAYGKLSSLLGLLLISTIPMLALQTVAARRCATDAGPTGIERGTVIIGVGTAFVIALLSPALAAFLHLTDIDGILLIAASVPGGAVLGTAMGVAQGRRAFRRLAALIVVSTGGRSAAGLAGLLLGHSPRATLLGIAVGVSLAALLVVASRRGAGSHLSALHDRTRVGVVVETLHAAHAHGTFLLLTSLDVLLARHVLPSDAAGVYAAGSVVTRVTVWLPQAVIALMFASLAETQRHHRTALRASALVVVLGAILTAGSAAVGPIVVTVFGGAKYHELDSTIWLFALLGSLLAVLQLSMLAGLAQRTARRAALLWATVIADVVIVLVTDSHATPTRLVVTLVSVAAVVASIAVWLTLRPTSRDTEQTASLRSVSGFVPGAADAD
jgi:O-antigen/teichoic acid export membrane protein